MKVVFENRTEKEKYGSWFKDLPTVTLITNNPAQISGASGYTPAFVEITYETSTARNVREAAEQFIEKSGWDWYRKVTEKNLTAKYAQPSLFRNQVSFSTVTEGRKQIRYRVTGTMYVDVNQNSIKIPISRTLAEQLLQILFHYRETRIHDFLLSLHQVLNFGTGYVELNTQQAKFIYSILQTIGESPYPVKDFLLRLKGGIELESEITEKRLCDNHD